MHEDLGAPPIKPTGGCVSVIALWILGILAYPWVIKWSFNALFWIFNVYAAYIDWVLGV